MENMANKTDREILSFKLTPDDLAAMGAAVGKLKADGAVNPLQPGAFTIRNHSFSTEKPGAFTIRNFSFKTDKPGPFTIRNYQFASA